MPLVRFEVRNEYGLGSPELYKAKNFGDHDVRRKKKENESKEILDGVAVAGLVGILRQLGDLAQLASDIFHDLHEQVMVTSARGRKLSNRIRNLEAEVPLVETAVKGQRSHIHYAYAAGCEYHANFQFEQSHLLSTDLPQYMMDSYEESRDPPRLYLLDKFDTNGSGACLKRYSDPSYFRTVWSASELEKAVKVQRERKGHKIKRKGSELNQESQLGSLLSQHFSSARFAYSNADEHHFSTDTSPLSTSRHNKPGLGSRPSSFDSRRLRFVEPVVDSNSSGLPDESEINSPCISKSHIIQGSTFALNMHDKANIIRMCPSPPVRWDEKSEISKPISPVSCNDILMDDTQFKPTQINSDDSDTESDISEMEIPGNEITSETENYLDASTILESETETDSEYQAKREFKSAENTSKNMDYFVGSEDPLMPSHSYTTAIQDPEEITVNQNDNHDNVPNETVCDSHERSEMFNADIVKGHQCFVNGNKCNENSCQLVMPEEGSEPAMPPCLTRSDQHQNYCVSSQIKNENSFEFEAVDDKPTFAGTFSKPINQISDSSSVKVEAAINRPPELNISNSTTIFESSANDSNSTTSPPVYTSNIPTPKLWTNGILLGLAPSKPPVFSAMNESNEVSASNACTENSPNKTRSWNSSHTENTNDGKSNYVEQNIPQNGFTKNLTESMPSESGQSTDDIKSSLASLAQRILANGLQRKQSIAQTPSEDAVRDFNRPSYNKAESDACFPDENVSSDTTMQLNSQFSGNSSPPLEHMKISFHPMNGSEVSNLKLEYATEDLTFPSFQLLPKSNNHLADHGSETDDDDDTFCRSGHYTSEDHESNSEMWEQDDMTVYSNRDAYDDLDRTSLSSSSVSSFKGFFQGGRRKTAYEFGHLEVENSMQYPQNDNSLNIPCLDSFVVTSRSQNELPPPPPLPPMQWRTSKGSSDKKEEKDFSVAEIVEHFNDIFNDTHPQRFTVDEQHEQNIPMSPPRTMHNVQMLNEHGETNGNDVSSKQLELEEELSHKFDNQHNVQMWNEHGQTNGNDVSSKQMQLEEAFSHEFDNQQENQKISGHTQSSYISGGQVVGEREDFLLQIRNKSFNLRRTSTTKSPSSVPQSTANINVAAILEKATAIRQAVVDSDGEDDDDNWSDS